MAGAQRDLKLEQSWRRHFQRHRAGGLTVRQYCLEHQLTESAFYFWRRTIAERDHQAESDHIAERDHQARPAFVPVVMADPPTSTSDTPIEIRLANGRRLRVRAGCDRALLADVVTLLEGRPC